MFVYQIHQRKSLEGPLLLGENLDATVREFVESLRKVGGVVNSIVMAAAKGIVRSSKKSIFIGCAWWPHQDFQRMGKIIVS